MKAKYIIIDWTYKVCFHGKEFKSFEDAEEFLSITLGDSYEEDRQEYEVINKDSYDNTLKPLRMPR